MGQGEVASRKLVLQPCAVGCVLGKQFAAHSWGGVPPFLWPLAAAFRLANSRADRIRTCDLFVPNEARYQPALQLDACRTQGILHEKPALTSPNLHFYPLHTHFLPPNRQKNTLLCCHSRVKCILSIAYQAPSWKRSKETTVMVSPRALPVSATSFSTEMEPSLTNSWLMRQLCL